MELKAAVGTRLGFIGAGRMAEAIARGLDKAGIISTSNMNASDLDGMRRKVFEDFGVSVWSSNDEVAERSDVLILAVKPQIVKPVVIDLKRKLRSDHLLVSIAAGVTLDNFSEWVGDARVVRVMPNTPCLVGESAAASSAGAFATREDVELVKTLFSALGKIHVVDEKLLNAVTGLSASGPAFVFVAIEALADGGVAAGLPRDVALSLAAQTVLGSAKMVLSTGRHPGQLKDDVASPGGTTIAGLHELEKAGFRGALINAVLAASKRSEELSGPSTKVTELREYAANVDVAIALGSIRTVGKIALQQYDVNAIVDRLLQFLEMEKDYVTAETRVLVKDSLRKYPQWSHDCIAVVGGVSTRVFKSLRPSQLWYGC